MYNDIEFVCSGSNGRSPVAKATAEKMVKILGRDDVRIYSSGTMVTISDIPNLAGIIAPYVEQAVRDNLLEPDRIERARADPQSVVKEMLALEESWRNKYIAESLGMDYSGHIRHQTIVRPGRRLILPVDANNTDVVQRLYSHTSEATIVSLPEFAGINISLDQKDFGRGYNDYAELAAKVETATRAAMHRALAA